MATTRSYSWRLNITLHLVAAAPTSGGNNTSFAVPRNASQNSFYEVTTLIERYSLPFICALGLVGNTLAAMIFFQRSLRKNSCCLYLAIRSVSDNGFLFSLMLIWIGGTFTYELNSINGICHMMNFLTFVCGCLSVWLVICVTVENYIRICRPFVVKRWCTSRNTKIVIAVLVCLVLTVYNFPLWISDSRCYPRGEYNHVLQALVYTDTVLTLVLPTLLMSTLTLVIIGKLLHSYKQARRISKVTSRSVPHRQWLPMAKVTKMLLAVSIIFVTLNVPSHIIRLKLLINSFMKGSQSVPDLDAAIQTISNLLYYTSLSVNIFIYLTFGSNFRKVFKKTFMKHQYDSPNAQRDITTNHAGNDHTVSVAVAHSARLSTEL